MWFKKLVFLSGAAQAGRSLWAQSQDGQQDHGYWDRLTSQNVGLWVGVARQSPWLGRAWLCGAGDQPCCGVTGAGVDSPMG